MSVSALHRYIKTSFCHPTHPSMILISFYLSTAWVSTICVLYSHFLGLRELLLVWLNLGGVRTPGHPQDRRHWFVCLFVRSITKNEWWSQSFQTWYREITLGCTRSDMDLGWKVKGHAFLGPVWYSLSDYSHVHHHVTSSFNKMTWQPQTIYIQ